MDFLFNDLGEQTVKDNKFHAFDVVIDDSHKRTVKTKSKSKVPLIAAIVGFLSWALEALLIIISQLRILIKKMEKLLRLLQIVLRF